MMLYSVWYLSTMNLVGFLSYTIYWTVMTLISIAFSLFTGSVGFLATLWFVKIIYGAIGVRNVLT